MQTNIKQDIIDASGLACPLPLLKVKQWLARAEPGARLRVIADDPGSARDIPRFLAASPHQLLRETRTDNIWVGEIEAGQ
ncbi:sulfurtransferase TusA family protein [Natronospirillum operosum]|uniref:Sulfurtransferase TusA family protein n=1 Tax=Natronospirillum operosum TaxID=2759953 RepID=A0A4Z0W8I9_9GAMM|nr:sulfurtransferase TusA family protein [Natronospirillum operosum]TGG93917.1 sulfurtransferase TusA family protein [Natronospirillum operosum]